MLYQTTHTTRYKYQGPVAQCLSEARVTPRSLPGQRPLETRIEVDPEPAVFEHRKDYFGNDVATFSVFRNHDQFTVTSRSVVEVEPRPLGVLPDLSWEAARECLVSLPDDESLGASEFVFDSPYVERSPELAEYARASFPAGRHLAEAVQDLCRRIHTEFQYKSKSTSIEMPLLQVLQLRRGVCQDFAHIMTGGLRSLHLAARYVSGYLRSGTKYQGAEASHAWVSVFIPGWGWLDLDPTNNVIPSDGHVTVAWGRDYGDVTPVKGISLGGGGQTVEVEVRVVPLES